MSKFISGWYVIYTKPRHEKKVFTQLAERSITTFLPTRKVLRNWHDRKKYVDEPLFPSYIFIYLNDMRNYYEGINTDGTLYYVKTGKEIARINETVVNNIKLATSQTKDIEVSDRSFQPGQQLVINKGILAGLLCEVVRVDSKKKLLVRVEFLRRNLLISLSEDNL
jgi:transcription antitermination factor NusG